MCEEGADKVQFGRHNKNRTKNEVDHQIKYKNTVNTF